MQQNKLLDDIFLRLAEMRGMLSVTQVGTVRGELRYRADSQPDLRAVDLVIEKGWLSSEEARALIDEAETEETPMPFAPEAPPVYGWSGDSVSGEDLQMELPPPGMRSGDSLFHDPFGQGQDNFVDHTPSLTPTPEVFDEFVQSPELEAQVVDEIPELRDADFDAPDTDMDQSAPGLDPSETAPGFDSDAQDDGHPAGPGRVTTLGLDDTYEVLPEPGSDTAADSDVPRGAPPRFKLRGSKGAVDDFSEFGENEQVASPTEMLDDSEVISQLISDSAVSEVMAQADDDFFGPPADLSESPDLLLDSYGLGGGETDDPESGDLVITDEPFLDADESSDHGVMHHEDAFIATVPPGAAAASDDEEEEITKLDTTEISDVLVNPQAEFPIETEGGEDFSEVSDSDQPSTTRYATGEEARPGLRDRTDTMLGHESGPQSGVEGAEDIEGSELTLADLRAQMGIGAGVKLSRHTHRMKKLAGTKRRYSVVREIARGGMGKVIEVEDNDLRRSVALKVLRKEMLARRDLVERFLEEAQITGQLEHPNIVPVHEIGVDGRGNLYFTMKLVEGETLSSLLKRLRKNDPEAAKAWPLARLIDLFIKVCEGVAFAHARGVIHRDLKPANIMVGRFGEVQIMDWGVAKILGREDLVLRSVVSDRQEDDSSRTVIGSVLGTPSYMSPEQARGELDKVGPESDVFSLGVILYEMLALVTPWTAKSSAQVLEQVKEEDPPTPSSRAPERKIPPELEKLAMKCLAKKPERRVGSASSLIDDLRSWQEGRTLSAVQYSLGQLLSKWINRHKVAVLSTLLVIFALMGGSIFAWRAAQQSSIDAAREAVAEADKLVGEAEASLGDGKYEAARESALAAAGHYMSAQNTLGHWQFADKLQRANEISNRASAQQIANDLDRERQLQQKALAEESRIRFFAELSEAENVMENLRKSTDDTAALRGSYLRARDKFVSIRQIGEGISLEELTPVFETITEIDAWLESARKSLDAAADLQKIGDLNVQARSKLREGRGSANPEIAESNLREVLTICDSATAITSPGEAAEARHNEARRIKAEAALELANLAIITNRLDIAAWMVDTARSTDQLRERVEKTAEDLTRAKRERSRFRELAAGADAAINAQDWALAVNQLQLAIEEGLGSSFVQPEELTRLRWRLDLAWYELAVAQAVVATESGASEQLEHALEAFIEVEGKLNDPEYKGRAASRIERLRRELGDVQYNEARKAEDDSFLGPAVTLYGKALKNLFDPTKREDARKRLEAIQTQLAAGQASDRRMLLRRGEFQVGSNREGDQNPLRAVTMNDFLLIDTYLVTNEDYKKFVDAGGYLNNSYWHEDALLILGSFVDTTGKPGPAGWARGGFDESLAKYPVTGLSWYEAAAYAKFSGKRLPTPEEWEIAAGAPRLGENPRSDYPFGERASAPIAGVKEPREVGTAEWDYAPGVPRDMGINVAEWTALREGARAQVRGAEPGLPTELYYRYARRAKVSVAPLAERSPGRGFRCIGEVRPQTGGSHDE